MALAKTLLALKPESILSVCQDLVRFNTVDVGYLPQVDDGFTVTAPTVHDVLDYIEEFLEPCKQFGVEVQRQAVDSHRQNLVARLPSNATVNMDCPKDRRGILLITHIDTPPVGVGDAWLDQTGGPWGAGVAGGQVHGLGANHPKSSISAMLHSFKAVSRKRFQNEVSLLGDVLLAFVSGGSSPSMVGLRQLLSPEGLGMLKGAGSVVYAGPTSNDVAVAQKGVLVLRCTCTSRRTGGGGAGAGGVSLLDDNPLERLAVFINAVSMDLRNSLSQVDTDMLLGKPTFNVGAIGGGRSSSTIPNKAWCDLELRLLVDQSPDTVQASITAVADGTGVTVERSTWLPPLRPFLTNPPIVRVALNAQAHVLSDPTGASGVGRGVQGCDVRRPVCGIAATTGASLLFEAMECPVIIMGPGDREGHESETGESMNIDRMVQATRIYTRLMMEYCTIGGNLPKPP